ncbi:MAG: hypothetical protein GY904_35310 [Planctomycetaceae bacterium]|jgi:hypothetical protein|nr:hypothetical protein [Planctomycetaceae bacterium]
MPDDQRRTDPEPLATNPYAPTSETHEQIPTRDDPEAYRRAHLKHEASCKSIGTLFLISSIIVTTSCFFVMLRPTPQDMLGSSDTPAFLGNLLVLLLSLIQGAVGLGLRQLRAWSKIGGVVFLLVGLLAFPIGTILGPCFLYLLLCKKGQIVFSPSYQNIITQTPHIRYRTSIITWLLALMILLLIVFSVLLLR